MEFGTWKLCEECSGKKCKMACVRKKCIHGSRAKSLIGAIEGTVYTSSHVYDRVARYICPSRFIEEKLLTVPRYAGKTTMIHNFLSKTADIDVPKGDYVLYFGRLSEEKGIDRILAACRLVPEIPFVIAGGGPLEELCRTCGLPNVRFVGFKTGRELQELVAAARFTLHLSLWYENCPLALLESQSLGTLADMLVGADVFIGVSAPNTVTTEMVKTMNKDAIIFACANPTPEIFPDAAKAGGARVISTGRSDYPNQINNVLAFPGIFRGVFDVRASDINEAMKVAAAEALAGLVGDDLSEDYIIPAAFDPRVGPAVAKAVAEAARRSGVARI